jgi:hypothetical protein
VIEFQMAVAGDAGVWGQTGFVIPNKCIHDLLPERFFGIKNVEGDTQPVSYGSGIFGVIQAAAGAVLGIVQEITGEHFHHGTGTFPAGLAQQMGGNRTVYTAAHGNHYFHVGTSFHGNILSQTVVKCNPGSRLKDITKMVNITSRQFVSISFACTIC